MVKYIIKRLLLALLILFGVSVILYALIRFIPTSTIELNYRTAHAEWDEQKIQEGLQEILGPYGLYDKTFGGVMKGYFMWLGNFLQGNMGKSLINEIDVSTIMAKSMWTSFGISFVALIFEMLIAIPLGVKCAVNQYGKLDYTATVLCMIGIAFPSFFLGNLLVKWFALDIRIFPLSGMGDGSIGSTIYHLILPMFVLVILNVGGLMRYTRTNTLEILNADYIRTARAKGLSEGKVIYKHVFRNTMIPLVTQLSFTLPGLFGGAMITEGIFGIEGIGKIAYDALKNGDVFLAMGYNMFIAVLTVVGVLLADIMYAVVDPRVKLGG